MNQNTSPQLAKTQIWLNNFSQFTDALAAIERALQSAQGPTLPEDRLSVSRLLDQFGASIGLTLPERELLRHAQNVRNARVHADPGITVSVELLHKVQAIAKRISPERSALTILKQAGAGGTRDGVLTVSPEDRLRDVLITMAAGDFSQVPAFDGQRLVGLLTAERVLLHIATSLSDSDESLALIDTSVLVADVIGAVVPCPCFPIDATPSDILAAFRQTEKSGATIHAAVISHSGVDTEKPLAIVCAADLPLFT